jgi:hypothetical protein
MGPPGKHRSRRRGAWHNPARDSRRARPPARADPEELERWIRICSAFVVEHLAGLADMPSWDTDDIGPLVESLP